MEPQRITPVKSDIEEIPRDFSQPIKTRVFTVSNRPGPEYLSEQTGYLEEVYFDPATSQFIRTGSKIKKDPVFIPPSQTEFPDPLFGVHLQKTPGSFLSHCGLVSGGIYRPEEEVYQQRRRPILGRRDASESLIKTLDSARLGRDDPLFGFALGVQSAFGMANDKKSKPGYETERVKRPPMGPMNLDSFDYNIHGETPEEILGSRFMRTVFPTDVARKQTMRQIFQRCMDDPGCGSPTFDIVMRCLGYFDLPRQHLDETDIAAIRTMDVLTKTGLASDEDLQLIPPPVLGNRQDFNPSLVKTLYSCLGLGPGTKFSLTRADSKPLNHYLPMLSSIITSSRLGRGSAFSLLLTILDGDLYTEIHDAMASGVSFESTWNYLQKTCGGRMVKNDIMKEMVKIFNAPPVSVAAALTKIQVLRTKYHADCTPAMVQKILIEENTIRDFLNYVAHHYKEEAPSIENRFHETKAAKKMERDLLLRQGYPVEEKLNSVWILKEIIIKHLSRPTMTMHGPSAFFSKLDLSLTDTESETQEQAATTYPESAILASLAADFKTITGAISALQVKPQKPQKNVTFDKSSQGTKKGKSQGSDRSQAILDAFQAYQQGVHDSLKTIQQQPQQTGQQGASVVPGGSVGSQDLGPPFANSTVPGAKDLIVDPRSTIRYNKQGQIGYYPICWTKLGKGICFLCASTEHLVRECPVYPNEYPSEFQCGCLGFHVTACKAGKQPSPSAINHVQFHLATMQQKPPQNQNQGGGGYNNYNKPRNNDGQQNNGGNNGNYNKTNNGNPRYNGRGGSQGSRGSRGGYNGNRNQNYQQNNQGYNQEGQQNYATGANTTPLGTQPSQGPTNDALALLGQAIATASQRAGTLLGNGGSQAVPPSAIMSAGQTNDSNTN